MRSGDAVMISRRTRKVKLVLELLVAGYGRMNLKIFVAQ